MIMLKVVAVAAAIAALLGTHPTVTYTQQAPAQSPLVARCAMFNPGAQLDPSCVVDERQAPQGPSTAPTVKGKGVRLPRMRQASVGAHIRAHVTATI